MQAVQNFACPIVSGAKKYDHVTTLLKSLSWLPVKDKLYYRQAIMAFKYKTGHAPEYLTSQFITREQVSERTTRRRPKAFFLNGERIKRYSYDIEIRLYQSFINLIYPLTNR